MNNKATSKKLIVKRKELNEKGRELITEIRQQFEELSEVAVALTSQANMLGYWVGLDGEFRKLSSLKDDEIKAIYGQLIMAAALEAKEQKKRKSKKETEDFMRDAPIWLHLHIELALRDIEAPLYPDPHEENNYGPTLN